MSNFNFDREKYIAIAKSAGVSVALTRLHEDVAEWEYQAFEGESGYQPKMWRELENVRTFSRELWDLSLTEPVSS